MIAEINTDAWLDYDLYEYLYELEAEHSEYTCESCGHDFDICEFDENENEICPNCKELI